MKVAYVAQSQEKQCDAIVGPFVKTVDTHSAYGVQTVYQGCCRTQRNVMVWKPKQMRIWVSTENNRGPEIRPDGGRRATSSFHAGLRLTDEESGQKVVRKQSICVRFDHAVRQIPLSLLLLFYLLVKTMTRMIATSMKRNWKSPRLLSIWEQRRPSDTPMSTMDHFTAPIDYRGSSTYRIEESDTDILDNAVEGHELEHTEGGDESSAALPVKAGKDCLIYRA